MGVGLSFSKPTSGRAQFAGPAIGWSQGHSLIRSGNLRTAATSPGTRDSPSIAAPRQLRFTGGYQFGPGRHQQAFTTLAANGTANKRPRWLALGELDARGCKLGDGLSSLLMPGSAHSLRRRPTTGRPQPRRTACSSTSGGRKACWPTDVLHVDIARACSTWPAAIAQQTAIRRNRHQRRYKSIRRF